MGRWYTTEYGKSDRPSGTVILGGQISSVGDGKSTTAIHPGVADFTGADRGLLWLLIAQADPFGV